MTVHLWKDHNIYAQLILICFDYLHFMTLIKALIYKTNLNLSNLLMSWLYHSPLNF